MIFFSVKGKIVCLEVRENACPK